MEHDVSESRIGALPEGRDLVGARTEIQQGFESFKAISDRMVPKSNGSENLPALELVDSARAPGTAGTTTVEGAAIGTTAGAGRSGDGTPEPGKAVDGTLEPGKAGDGAAEPGRTGDATCRPEFKGGDHRVFNLSVKSAGASDSIPPDSLTAFVIDDKTSGTTRLATAAHGIVSPESEPWKSPYRVLDAGFKQRDLNGDQQLSRDELRAAAAGVTDPETLFQLKYIENNYDAILTASRSTNPAAAGITNEGLASHYMKNSEATISTTCGAIPLRVVAGDRATDVAVLESKDPGLSGIKGFTVADRKPIAGEGITAIGYPARHPGELRDRGAVLDYRDIGLIPAAGVTVKALSDKGFPAGMSGGPVVAEDGKTVLGLVHAQGGIPRIGYFVHADSIRSLLERSRRNN